jgi:hypothetical protein
LNVDDGSSISAHEGLDRDKHDRAKYLGYVLQFDGWKVYHSGDTVRYEGMAEKLRPFKIDVALLPINCRAAERRIPGNLFGTEAAQLAKDIGAKLVSRATTSCLSSIPHCLRNSYVNASGLASHLNYCVAEKDGTAGT